MKAKDKTTGQFKKVYVKALDGMPVGSEIDYSGNISDIPTGWEQVTGFNTVGYVLYEDSSGTTGTVTLNDSVSNYDYLEVYYARDVWCSSRKIDTSLSLSHIDLSLIAWASSITRIYTSDIAISGTSITRNYTRYINFPDSGTGINAGADNIKIYKVIGYKEA